MAHILLQNKKKKTDTLSQSVAKSLTYDLLPGLIGQCACFCSHHGWVAFFSCIWNYISWVQNAFWCVFDVPLKSWGWSIWWCREGVTIRCHFFFLVLVLPTVIISLIVFHRRQQLRVLVFLTSKSQTSAIALYIFALYLLHRLPNLAASLFICSFFLSPPLLP